MPEVYEIGSVEHAEAERRLEFWAWAERRKCVRCNWPMHANHTFNQYTCLTCEIYMRDARLKRATFGGGKL